MYALFIYSLKAAVCLAVFYLFFKLLLSRETFHRFNRFVVLAGMLLAFVLPLCVVTVYRELPVLPAAAVPLDGAPGIVVPEEAAFDWRSLLGVLFVVGASVMLLHTLRSVVGVARAVRSGRRERLDDGTVLVRMPAGSVAPFSWWRYVVVSEDDMSANGREILCHERAHLRLRHSADLLIADLAGCLQWFNPAMWLLRRELRAIHEYEADRAVIASGADVHDYQLLLIRKAVGGRWYSVANSFNHSKLKNRITMMLQKRSSRWAGAKALFVVPLAGLALGAFAETVYLCPKDKDTQENAAFQIFDASDSSRMTVRVGDPADKRIVIVGKDGRETSQPAPLYLVDGEAVDDLKQVDKKRIRSITVLKDSSCTEYVEKYGDKAKNGVILVTLKKEGEPDNAVPADAKNMDDVVVVGSGTSAKNGLVEWNSDEWKARQKKFAEMDAYFQSDEWKARQKKLEEGAAYFNSDEWKAVEKKLAKVDKYFQSDEWKESQKRLSRFSAGASGDTRIYIIDGKKATEAEVKALAGNDIASMNFNKEKQDNGSVVSTFIVTTKGKTARAENRSGKTILDMRGRMAGVKMPFMSVSGKKVTISRDGDVETYKGIFRVTDLSRVPNDAVIRLDGKPANRLQIMAAKKLRRARYYTGKAAVKQSGAKHFLDCHTRK